MVGTWGIGGHFEQVAEAIDLQIKALQHRQHAFVFRTKRGKLGAQLRDFPAKRIVSIAHGMLLSLLHLQAGKATKPGTESGSSHLTRPDKPEREAPAIEENLHQRWLF